MNSSNRVRATAHAPPERCAPTGTAAARRTGGMLLAAGALLCAASMPARADGGRVVWRNLECSFFILQTDSGGFGLYQHLSGPKPELGAQFEGELERFGSWKIQNVTLNSPTMVYSDVYTHSRNKTTNQLPPICKKVASAAESID
jgi:hypothetical protein